MLVNACVSFSVRTEAPSPSGVQGRRFVQRWPHEQSSLVAICLCPREPALDENVRPFIISPTSVAQSSFLIWRFECVGFGVFT